MGAIQNIQTQLYLRNNTGIKPASQSLKQHDRSVKSVKSSQSMSLLDIPATAFAGQIKFTSSKPVTPDTIDPKQIKRAVLVNDQDFDTIKGTSTRYIKGVHPGVSLRTDDFIVTDTKKEVVIPGIKDDLIFPTDSMEFDQVNALVHATETADMINNFWGFNAPWAFEGPVNLNAHARFFNSGNGEYVETWDNAFYNRNGKEIALLIAENKREKGVIYSARSSDTIAHETGHAKLDGLEKYFADSKCFVTVGIHEAFADFNAMLHAMQSDKVIDIMLQETKGDLRKDNVVSRFDEQFGQKVLINGQPCLRSAINDFKMPSDLDKIDFIPVKKDQLGIEPHIFSQLFTGTLYDSFVKIYESLCKQNNNDQKAAVIKAREDAGKTFNRAFLYLPSGEVNFKDLAIAMLQVDRLEHNSRNQNAFIESFKARNILTNKDIKNYQSQIKSLPSIKLDKEEEASKAWQKALNEYHKAINMPEGNDYKVSQVLKTSSGEQFVKYTRNKVLAVPGEKDVYYNLASNKIDVQEGITLKFNKEGILESALTKTIQPEVEKDLLTILKKYAEFRYKPLQDSYDEIAKEWEREQKRRKEKNKRKQQPVIKHYPEIKQQPEIKHISYSTVHSYDRWDEGVLNRQNELL
jgi:hypothetical protein